MLPQLRTHIHVVSSIYTSVYTPTHTIPDTNTHPHQYQQGGEDDIDALLAKFALEDAGQVQVQHEASPPSARTYATFIPGLGQVGLDNVCHVCAHGIEFVVMCVHVCTVAIHKSNSILQHLVVLYTLPPPHPPIHRMPASFTCMVVSGMMVCMTRCMSTVTYMCIRVTRVLGQKSPQPRGRCGAFYVRGWC